MRVSQTIVALLLGAIGGAGASGAQSQVSSLAGGEAETFLQHVAETYRSLERFYFRATQITETRSPDVQRTTEVEVVTALDSSGRARLEVFDEVNSQVTVFDGRTRWVHWPQRGEYEKEIVAPEAKAAVDHADDLARATRRYPVRYGGVATNLIEARLLRREEISAAGKSGDHVVVQAEYKSPPGVPPSVIRRTYWIDEQTFLVAREVSAAKMKRSGTKASTEVKETISFSEMKINEAVPEEAFAFVPPEGAKPAREFVSPTERWVGRPAPDVTLRDLNGRSYSLTELRGKVILLDFWATWCAPCRIDLPHIEKLHQEFGRQGLVVLGVNGEAPARAAGFFEEHGYSFPSLVDRKQRVAALYDVGALPTVIIIDRQGKIASYLTGLQSEEHLREELAKAGIE